MWGKWNPDALMVGMKGGKTTMETVWILKKLKTDLPYDPAMPLLGIYLKDCESAYNKSTCTPMFIAALFIIAKV
jgi:hypothetical protein